MFDVRFLPNPHYEPDLRPLTGNDPRVVEFINQEGALDDFYENYTYASGKMSAIIDPVGKRDEVRRRNGDALREASRDVHADEAPLRA